MAKSARLSLRQEHAWKRLATYEGDVRAYASVRKASCRSQLPARHDGCGDCGRTFIRSRWTNALSSRGCRRFAGRGLRDRSRALQDLENLRQRELEPRPSI